MTYDAIILTCVSDMIPSRGIGAYNTRTTWPLFAIASLGIRTVEELTSIGIKDMDMNLVCQKRDERIAEYKNKLINKKI
jgi:hypothetical protein